MVQGSSALASLVGLTRATGYPALSGTRPWTFIVIIIKMSIFILEHILFESLVVWFYIIQ